VVRFVAAKSWWCNKGTGSKCFADYNLTKYVWGKKVSVIIIIIGDLNNGVHKGSKGVIFAKYVITLPYG